MGEKFERTKMGKDGPPAAQKFAEALKSKNSFGKGVSRPYCYKWIGDTYPGTSLSAVRRAVSKMVEEGLIVHGKTKARFKLTDEGKAKFFAPKPKKKKAAKKKTKAKRAKRRTAKKPKKKSTKKRGKKTVKKGKESSSKKKKIKKKKPPKKPPPKKKKKKKKKK